MAANGTDEEISRNPPPPVDAWYNVLLTLKSKKAG
jgi:hypothetical protein